MTQVVQLMEDLKDAKYLRREALENAAYTVADEWMNEIESLELQIRNLKRRLK